MYESCLGNAWSKPATLEKLSARSLIHRILREKSLLGETTFSDALPFLRGSFVSHIRLSEIADTLKQVTIPKMVFEKGTGGAKPLSEFTNNNERLTRETQIKNFLTGVSTHPITVNVQDWPFIYNNVPQFSSLEPLEKSSSPDHILSLSNLMSRSTGEVISYRIGLQQKSSSTIDSKLIATEGIKFLPILSPTAPVITTPTSGIVLTTDSPARHTLIIVGFGKIDYDNISFFVH